jgi:hypothetical protein
VKYDADANAELSYYHGLLNAAEDAIWWRAKLAAEKAGVNNWQKAIALLTAAGWTVREEGTP